MKKLFIFIFSVLISASSIFAQDDLLDMINEGVDDGNDKVYATFKSYKLGNCQTVETAIINADP